MKMTDDEMDALLKSMELDEPSLSFRRNVMGQVTREVAPVVLKTRVNKRIIYGITAFFVACMLGAFLYALASSSFEYSWSKLDLDLVKAMDKFISPQFLRLFLMLDTVIALIWLDSVLRKKLA